MIVVKVYVNCDGTSTALADTCHTVGISTTVAGTYHAEYTTFLVAVKINVVKVDGTSTTAAATCHTVGRSTTIADICQIMRTTAE